MGATALAQDWTASGAGVVSSAEYELCLAIPNYAAEQTIVWSVTTFEGYFKVTGDTGSPADDAPWGLRLQSCPVDNEWGYNWSGSEVVPENHVLEVWTQENLRRTEFEEWTYNPTSAEYSRQATELVWATAWEEVYNMIGQGGGKDPGN